MHRELIPKEITIVRCYYEQEVVAPGTRFGFDINGSGFTEQFERMISVDPDALDVSVENLRLVTANQIHGDMVVGTEATTQYISPKVLIRNLPVFKAPEPFGVVRPGEVLDIVLTQIDETGQSGHFRIITNLDAALMKQIRVEPTTEKLEVVNLSPKHPFYLNGTLRIEPGVTSGQYGLVAFRANRMMFKKDPLVDVVRPTVGRTGSVENLTVADKSRRPGDLMQVQIHGTGFMPSDATTLGLQIEKVTVGPSTFTYVSPGRIDAAVKLPPEMPVGVYGVTILSRGKKIYDQKGVFGIVPANWLGSVRLARPLAPGQTGTLQVKGRDINFDFAQSLKVETDDPGLLISPLRVQDSSTLTADVRVGADVAPGDYLVTIRAGDQPVRLPGGAIIKIGR